GRGPRGHEREAVDLAVRVVQRDPDLLTPVLEAVDLGDAVQGAEGRGPVGPRLHDRPGPLRGQPGERPVVVGGEADHLAAAVGRPLRDPSRFGGTGRGAGSLRRFGAQPTALRYRPW